MKLQKGLTNKDKGLRKKEQKHKIKTEIEPEWYVWEIYG